MMQLRLARLRSALKRRKLDGLLVSQPENRRFLSGYTATDVSLAETSGFLFIPVNGHPFLLTDSRYQLQAESEATGYEVRLYRRGIAELLAGLLPSIGGRRIGFESQAMLHATAVRLMATLNKLAIEVIPVVNLIEKQRLVKTAEELGRIRKAVALNEEVFQAVYGTLQPGQTEKQVAMKIENTMRARGADGPCFETIVAGGPNSALPHAVPTDRPLREGEPIIIDMGTRLKGYCSDMTRTVVLGKMTLKTTQLMRIVRKAQCAAMENIRAGITAQEADRTARRIIAGQGYGDRFGHGLGHGVGLAVHEAPSINRRSRRKLAQGMVVTVEPGIYLPGWGGIRLENMVAIQKDGCEVLNRDMTFLEI
jgi:Xaa-Pro aminopeptidase